MPLTSDKVKLKKTHFPKQVDCAWLVGWSLSNPQPKPGRPLFLLRARFELNAHTQEPHRRMRGHIPTFKNRITTAARVESYCTDAKDELPSSCVTWAAEQEATNTQKKTYNHTGRATVKSRYRISPLSLSPLRALYASDNQFLLPNRAFG